MSGNCYRKLSVEIIPGIYELVYYVAEKYGNYRDTGVSKNNILYILFNAILCNLNLSIFTLSIG